MPETAWNAPLSPFDGRFMECRADNASATLDIGAGVALAAPVPLPPGDAWPSGTRPTQLLCSCMQIPVQLRLAESEISSLEQPPVLYVRLAAVWHAEEVLVARKGNSRRRQDTLT